MSEPPEPPEPLPPWPRRRRGELVSAAAALLLLALMFLAEWFGVDGIPGRSQISSAENAWHGLTVTRWVMLATIAVPLLSLIVHPVERGHGVRTATGLPIALLGTVTAILLTWRVLIELPSPGSVVDQKLGAYLGVLSAYAIALGGYDSMRGSHARRRAPSRRGRSVRPMAERPLPR